MTLTTTVERLTEYSFKQGAKSSNHRPVVEHVARHVRVFHRVTSISNSP